MLELVNHTPFVTHFYRIPDEHGDDTLYVLLKASFHMSSDWALLEQQVPVWQTDIFDVTQTELLYPAEIHTGKQATDVFISGKVCCLDGRVANSMDVHVCIGHLDRVLTVHGRRDQQNRQPEPFSRMNLSYRNAYGGQSNDHVYVRNPIGKGYADNELPNLSWPSDEVAGFSPIHAHWPQRYQYAGTYDQVWRETRAPYLPADFDSRFCQSAHPDMIYSGFMQSGEPVYLSGLHPAGDIQFDLQRLNPVMKIQTATGHTQERAQLETLWLEPNQYQYSMTWRFKHRLTTMAENIQKVTVQLTR